MSINAPDQIISALWLVLCGIQEQALTNAEKSVMLNFLGALQMAPEKWQTYLTNWETAIESCERLKILYHSAIKTIDETDPATLKTQISNQIQTCLGLAFRGGDFTEERGHSKELENLSQSAELIETVIKSKAKTKN